MSELYLTRVTLIGNIKENKEEAWNEFCLLYWDLITGWARQLGCTNAVAQDVFQETIVSLMRQLPNFDYDIGKGRFRSFIKTIVKRRIYDMYRIEGRYVNLSSTGKGIEDDDYSGIEMLDKINLEQNNKEVTYDSDLVWLDSMLKTAVKNVAQKVEPTSYLSFKLYVLEERPVEEVIKATGIGKVGTVYQHKSRFLSALKNEFYNLLDSTGEVNNINQVGDKLFNQTLAHVIAGRGDLKTTIVDDLPPEELLTRLGVVKTLLNETGVEYKDSDNSLLVIDDGEKIEYPLNRNMIVGRSDKADIRLNYDDVSSIHSTILLDESGGISLKDEFSTNGTFLNGKKISEPIKLIPGDIIQIGANTAIIVL